METTWHEEQSPNVLLSDHGQPCMNTITVNLSEEPTDFYYPKRSLPSGEDSFWRSSTCIINTKNLFICSFANELLTSMKFDSLAVLTFLCGLGYEGRLTISWWFCILETISSCPVAIGVAAFGISVYIISNV